MAKKRPNPDTGEPHRTHTKPRQTKKEVFVDGQLRLRIFEIIPGRTSQRMITTTDMTA